MKERIGNGFIYIAILCDLFLYFTIKYWNASTISDEEFWPTFAVLLCVRITLAWGVIFILSLMDIQLKLVSKVALSFYLFALVVHTIWFSLQVL